MFKKAAPLVLVVEARGVLEGWVRSAKSEQRLALRGRIILAAAADVVGLYLHPPDNAVVLSVDEKPHIQALERAQGYLKLPNGRALRGVSHEYKRHGTTTLFAALNVLTGTVVGAITTAADGASFWIS